MRTYFFRSIRHGIFHVEKDDEGMKKEEEKKLPKKLSLVHGVDDTIDPHIGKENITFLFAVSSLIAFSFIRCLQWQQATSNGSAVPICHNAFPCPSRLGYQQVDSILEVPPTNRALL